MKKKSIIITKHPTSVSLEPEFWEALQKLALLKKTSVRQLIIQIDMQRKTNLSSALRVYILQEIQKQIIPLSEYDSKNV